MHGMIHCPKKCPFSSFFEKGASVYVVAAFFSIVLSFWAAIKEPVINPDAICYLQSAEAMKMGLQTAMHLCGQAQWPFFSMLIYGLASLTHLSSLASAYILDGLFSLISVLSFIKIIQFFRVPSRMLWLAAMVILLLHEFNSVRFYIVRDHGFWACYLVSILLLLHYFHKPQWKLALCWSVSLMLAMLFRIEGLVFLLFLPWIAWINGKQKWMSRLQAFFQLNTVMLLATVCLGLWMLLHSSQNLGRVSEVTFQMINGVNTIVQNFNAKADALANHVLSIFAARDAKWILLLMMCSWYTLSVVANLSLVYAVLVVYAWYQKLFAVDKSARVVIWAYVLVNVLITSAFLIENMFLSKRYLLALSLVLMVWVPFALNELIQQWQKHRKWSLIIALFFIFISALGGIFDFGYSKAYVRQAGDWLAENVPQNAALYSNDYQVMYYSHHFGNDIFAKAPAFTQADAILNGKWKQYDYLALRSPASFEKEWQLIKTFKNKRGDEVRIYKIPH